MPFIKYLFANINTISIGSSEITEPASIRFQEPAAFPELLSAMRPTIKVRCSGIDVVNTAGIRYSFQEPWKPSIPTVTKIGFKSGSIICVKVCKNVQPSIFAASSSSFGIELMYSLIRKIFIMGIPKNLISTSPHKDMGTWISVSTSKSAYTVIEPMLINISEVNTVKMALLPRNFPLSKTYAFIVDIAICMATTAAVYITLFLNKLTMLKSSAFKTEI